MSRPYTIDAWAPTDDGPACTLRASGMVIGRVRQVGDRFAADQFGKGAPTFKEAARFDTLNEAVAFLLEPPR